MCLLHVKGDESPVKTRIKLAEFRDIYGHYLHVSMVPFDIRQILKSFSLFTAEDRICQDAPTILRNRLKPCFNPDPVTPWLDLCGQKF